MMTDPIADLLTRIRNANRARKDWADVPWSKLKEAIARVLVEEGFLREASVNEENGRKLLRVTLKYDEFRRPVVSGIRRVSRPSLRVYVGGRQIPVIRKGLGISVLSTPKGVIADRVARKENVGGEVICSVW
ncbi:MAG TPA: 30S ribosomal protein S8 [Candidatus Binatia bacterium]|nr:30S ribosomal protein S8 [Candidatus Binatia bacterium]